MNTENKIANIEKNPETKIKKNYSDDLKNINPNKGE